MKLTETTSVAPMQAQKSMRPNEIRALTSAEPGKIHPVTVFPLLREDRISDMRIRMSVDMMETEEMLFNGVRVTARAVFVPHLAMDRFEGSLDRFNRSYEGIPDKDGGDVVPYFTTHTGLTTDPFYKALGLHRRNFLHYNTAYVASYNQYVNYLYRSMSNKLPQRDENDATLAACPWGHNSLSHIVSDFDQAMIDGELDLNINAAMLPVSGIGLKSPTFSQVNQTVMEADGDTVTYAQSQNANDLLIEENPDNIGFPKIFAELANQGITLSLSNIELAKKTAAFAQIMKRYKGLTEDHVIDLLMAGIRVPDAELAQPILLAKKSTLLGYNQRFATDSANLEKSVTTGMTEMELRIRTPAFNTGGVVLVTFEAVPEPLYERTMDPYLFARSADDLPSFTRDYLDPEKVSVVKNEYVDVYHSNPDATFGYAPLNHEWRRSTPNIGGKYYRVSGDPFDENRQKIWSVEQLDPELTSDFYLATNIHKKVFKYQDTEPFEIVCTGQANIIGNTVFGKGLEEATSDYDNLIADTDTGRIEQ